MSDRQVFGGATILAACACGTASGLASVGEQAGYSLPSSVLYPALLGTGGALFAAGIRDRSKAWLPTTLAFLAFAAALTLAPQSIMHGSDTFARSEIVGFFFYYLAGAFFVWAAVRLYAPERPLPAAVSLGAMVLAAGCTCCLAQGATRYLGIAAGLDPSSFLVSRTLLLGTAVTVASLAALAAGARSAVPWLVAGAIVIYPVQAAMELLVPSLVIGGAELRFLTRYPVWLAGAGLLLFGASRALFVTVSDRVEARPAPTPATA